MKITVENQAFLKRLQDKTATYSVEKWDSDFRETEKRMKSLCEYPFVLQTNPQMMLKSRLEDDSTRFQTASELPGVDSALLSRGKLPRVSTAVGQRGPVTRSYNSLIPPASGGGTAETRKVLIKQAEALDENRIVLYKKGRQMGDGYYIIEISSNNSCLFIAAYDVESPESLLIELSEKKAEDIMKEFNNDYEQMATCLQIMNRRLVLLNPVGITNFYYWYRNTISKS